jgi:hypothetical protein
MIDMCGSVRVSLLRTGRDSFQSNGSSPSKASLGKISDIYYSKTKVWQIPFYRIRISYSLPQTGKKELHC